MIRKIKWENYNVLGNLELDFTKKDGSTYNTIILAGENGTGKTTILNNLSEFLNIGSLVPFKFIEYGVEGNNYTIFKDYENISGAQLGFHKVRNESTGNLKTIEFLIREDAMKNATKEDIFYYGVSYSKVRSDFDTRKVVSTTTQQLDNTKYDIEYNNDFTAIKQLLVDIDGQDSSSFKRLNKIGRRIEWKDFEKKDAKIFRFENAFNNFFNDIKFTGIDDSSIDEKKITFEKYGRTIYIDELSTGEKQIVYRGAHLLKNSKSIENGTVLIDEPELSMHPKWQEKILDYYRGLFSINGQQNVQMIIATHSEYVLRAALEDRDNVLIIVLENDNGVIKNKRITAPTVLPTVTAAETNYLAFGIISIDYHIELYGYLQTKENKSRIDKCDEFIEQSPLYDSSKHSKQYTYRNTTYKTLPTYIRNAIDHPDSGNTYTKEELEESINLLIKLCK